MTPTPLVRTTYGAPASHDAGFIQPKADYGAAHAFSDNLTETFQNWTLGGTMANAGKYALADMLAKQEGIEPITEDEFNRDYAPATGLKWVSGMSKARARLMFEDRMDSLVRQERLSGGSHPVAALFGSVAGSLHPVDLLFSGYVSRFSVVPRSLGVAEKIAQTTSVPKSAVRAGLAGLAENTYYESLIASTAGYRQQEYTSDMMLMNMGFGTVFSSTMGAARAIGMNANPNVRSAMAQAAVESALGSDAVPPVLRVATLDPKAHAQAQANASAQRATERPGPASDADIDEVISHLSAEEAKRLADNNTPFELGARAQLRKNEIRRRAEYVPSNPVTRFTQKVAMERSRSGQGDDELLLSETFKKVFGVDVRFYDQTQRGFFGGYGVTTAKQPKLLFIEAGKMDKMLYVAGHELGHSLRYRDPGAWDSVIRAVLTSGDETLVKAYRQAIAIQGGSRAWKLMSRTEKMDEAMANVLGDAMRSREFWNTLYRRDAASANKLVSFLRYLAEKIQRVLMNRKTDNPRIQALHRELAGIIYAVDPEAKAPADMWRSKKVADSNLRQMYSPYISRFTGILRKEAGNARRLEQALDEIDEVINDLAPEVHTMEDRSLALTIIEKEHIRIDPQRFVLEVLFKKYYPKLWKELSGPDGAKVRKEVLESGPFFSWKRNQDGSHTFYLHKNDQFVKWMEDRTVPDDLDNTTSTMVHRFLDDAWDKGSDGNLRQMREEYIKSLIFENRHRGDIISPDSPYYSILPDYEIFIQGYRQYLNEIAARYRLENDQRNYQNIFDQLKEIEDTMDVSQPDGAKLAAAWDDFRKRVLKPQKIGDFTLNRPERPGFMIGDSMVAGTKEAIEELRADIRKEVAEELRLLIDAYNTLIKDPDPEVGPAIKQAIDTIVEDRMEAIIPNYKRVDGINSAAKAVMSGESTLVKIDGDESLIRREEPDADDVSEHMSADPDKSFPEHALEVVDEIRGTSGNQRMSLFQASRQALLSIERENRNLAAWREDYRTTVAKTTEKSLEDAGLADVLALHQKTQEVRSSGLAGEELRSAAAEAEKAYQEVARNLTRAQAELLRVIISTNQRTERRQLAVASFIRNHSWDLSDKNVKSFSESELAEMRELVELAQRMGDTDPFAEIELQGRIKQFQAVRHYERTRGISATLRKGVKHLYSYLDGLSRKGVESSGVSVHADKRTRISQDTSPLINAIESHGLYEAWEGNLLTRALILEMRGLDTGINDPVLAKQVRELATVLRTTQSAQLGRLNSLGAHIRTLNDFVFSQVHNPHLLRKTGFEKWASDMNQWIDWDRTMQVTGIEGTQQARMAYLRSVYDDVVGNHSRDFSGIDPETMGGNLASSVSRRRSIHFRDSRAFDYDMAYGSGDTASLIISQIVSRAERSVFMDHFGPNHLQTWNAVMGEASFPKGNSVIESEEIRRMTATFMHLTGALDNPVNQNLAAAGQALRSYVNLVASWATTISSVTDIAGAAAQMRFMGMKGSLAETAFIQAMKEAHRRGGQASAWLRGQGAGMGALLGAAARRSGEEFPVSHRLRALNDKLFKYNGMNWWSRIVQEAYVDLATKHLGGMVGAKTYSPEFRTWLSTYGIDENEFRTMLKSAREVEGFEGIRLSPDMIQDPTLSRKLASALDDGMRYALLEPSVSDEAILRFGTKAGTIEGEAFRTMMQFKGFPLALIRKMNARFNHAYGEGVWSNNLSFNTARQHRLAYFGAMMFLGWSALTIKDILRGREPMHFTDSDQWNTQNFVRLVSQASTLGLYEDLFSTNEARQVTALVGPAGGMAYSLGRAAVMGDKQSTYRRANAVLGVTPGASIPFANSAMKGLFSTVWSDSYDTYYQASLRRHRTLTGQGHIAIDTQRNPN